MKKVFWVLAGIALSLLMVCVALMLMGPVVGNVFSNVNTSLAGIESDSPGHELPTNGGISSEGIRQSVVAQIPQRVIIRDGYISLAVKDTRASSIAIEQMVKEMETDGAFIVTSRETSGTDDPMPEIQMTIRVPAKQFDEVMDRLAALGVKVLDRSETAEDVTEEYVDLQARLEAMETARERLKEIMSKAETVEELLSAEQQLTMREAEIESIQGRLEYLTQSAQISKIEITLQPSVLNLPLGVQWQPGETVRKAYRGLVKSAQGAVNLLIYFAIVGLPWLVILGLLLLGVRRIVRRYQTRPLSGQKLS
jgi:vacuolar-type H+-ATPase subunit I/STV1